MFENTTTGEWVVLGLSLIFGFIWSSNFVIIFILSLIALFVLYWVITKVHPSSNEWGFVPWVVSLLGISFIILLIIGVGMGYMAGSHDPEYQWVNYSNYGISFNHPSIIPINTRADGYSSASYYDGQLQFNNTENQGIALFWGAQGKPISQEFIQEMFTSVTHFFQKDVPDIQVSSIQTSTHSGNTIHYATFEGHDLTENGKMLYGVFALWEDLPSQRYFVLFTSSYKSKEDARVLFDGVLNSFEGH